MLKISPSAGSLAEARSDGASLQAPDASVASILASLARDRWLFLLCLLACMIGGAIYLALVTPSYTARTKLALDMRRDQAMPRAAASEGAILDSSYVQTQVELIKSERVLLAAIRSEDLLNDAAFTAGPPTLPIVRWVNSQVDFLLASVLGGAKRAGEFSQTRVAVGLLQNGLHVERAGLTSVIEIRFRSHTPVLAARIANAVSRAYMDDQVEGKHEAIRRAGLWLQDRIAELREQSSGAARAVQNYKTANNIVETPRGRMNEQQLGDLNTQLVIVRAQTAEARVRLDRVREVLDSGAPEAAISDVLRSDVITRLRNQYFDVSQRESDIIARLGNEHRLVLDARHQMAELRRLIREELQRVAESIRSDHEIAMGRQHVLEAAMATAIRETAVANEAMLTLRELESSALSFKTIYDAFLRNYTETIQAQSYRFAEARVITEATPPFSRSHPKRKIVLSISALMGLGLGLGLKLTRDHLRNALRTRQEVRRHTGSNCLGEVPILPGRPSRAEALCYASRHRSSAFAESFRDIIVELRLLDPSTGTRVIGVAGSLPSEGATTVAANLAQVLGMGGTRALLIDANLHSDGLTKALGYGDTPGVADICNGTAPESEVCILALDGFDFLPKGVVAAQTTASDLLASPSLTNLIETSCGAYAAIVIDLPPVLSVVDARIATRLIDSSLLVIEFGQTNADAVCSALEALQTAGGSVAGCVLNKVRNRRY